MGVWTECDVLTDNPGYMAEIDNQNIPKLGKKV